ncbi:MAG: hypothetical protein AVDCRST_MAG39-2397 [uncultured Sphingomonadaceae bacterium]|uniref:Thioredoxin domain-containing protein n=1 Tax=uncultured Sphingomonadaceae bacterium TaxID=169976 RepID=A0A6J4TDJ7_9SPHN|nr:MAG: hypothetical protein AVDCRST_MAG39-2397 [uncultured Sphingomonadaceae bacterium]
MTGARVRTAAIAGFVGLLLGLGGYALADRGSGRDRARTEAIVRDYLLTHPEVLVQAGDRLRQREAASVVDRHRAALETPYAGAFKGNPNGDVVLVEFFDYACGYCRAADASLDRLLAEDPGLKVVLREMPVLGEPSVAAARASLAAARAGRFTAFYDALYAAGRPSPETIARARAAAGLPANSEDPAAGREIARNLELAGALGGTGTPLFVVGDRVFPGMVPYETLKAAVAEARERRT